MKYLFTLTLLLIGAGGVWYAYANFHPYVDGQEYMDISEAEKRWGQKPFDRLKFKDAPMRERAAMAVDLIKRKLFIDKPIEKVRHDLGPTSGYFVSERIPTFFIEEGWHQNRNSWQLVFLTDRNGKIDEVRIHKNCCSDDIWKEKGLSPPKD